MSVINTQPLIGASGNQGYNIDRSLRLRSSASASLTRTPASTGNLQKWTWSGWVKRGSISTLGQAFTWYNSGFSYVGALRFEANDTLNIYEFNIGSSAYIWNVQTTQVFRDPSAWYHIVIAYDSTQATAANRVIIYVNGVAVSSYSATNYPSLNYQSSLNRNGYPNYIGAGYNGTTLAQYFDGYLADTYLIDGQQLTPSSFGETNSATGVWRPKKYSGTYGTNGFYLNFKDNSAATATTIGKDSSGNGNNFTPTNISVTAGATYDSMTDVPTLNSPTAANYCVLNPLQSAIAPSNANLQLIATTGWQSSLGTIGVSSGKWYWEIYITNQTIAANGGHIGVAQNSFVPANYPGYNSTSYAYRGPSGEKVNNGTFTAYGATYATGDTIAIALDMDAGTLTFYKNNVSQGTAFTGLSGTYLPIIAVNGSPNTFDSNFGQRPFTYTPPTGYKALNTFNLPDSTIKAGNKVIDSTLYTGTGATLSVTNAGGFKPDLVLLKSRSAVSNIALYDSVRGATKVLYSNLTDAEGTATLGLTSFNTNGFSLGTGGVSNTSGATYVGWQWQAGQGSTSSNTSGSITSTVSVNASAGFSIVSWTGTGAAGTLGHGLGVAPKIIIVKSRSNAATNYPVYHISTGNTGSCILNGTDAFSLSSGSWNNTTPTSSVFTVGNGGSSNPSGSNQIAYCWSEVEGFSKFGSYTGNGSADGPFIYTGFRPEFYLFKRTDSAGNWYIFDTSRGSYNINTPVLFTNRTDAETPNTIVDFLSNGIKIRSSGSVDWNASGGTYIYMAFAENPFKNSLAR
jgi:hypothetical protein